jgi:predicted RNase H-like HicB family nuclease
MERFVYPATLTPDTKDGGFVVTFADVPEAIMQGENV